MVFIAFPNTQSVGACVLSPFPAQRFSTLHLPVYKHAQIYHNSATQHISYTQMTITQEELMGISPHLPTLTRSQDIWGEKLGMDGIEGSCQQNIKPSRLSSKLSPKNPLER